VLETPERNRAPQYAAPRRVSASPNRKLRRDFSEDFGDEFPDEDIVPAARRRGGMRVRFRGLPSTMAGRIAAGVAAAIFVGLCFGVAWFARDMLMHDDRFVIRSYSSIEIQGNTHVTRAQLLSVFGEDVERNIFNISLAERRAELEKLPWVAHATVMRLLPNRMRVSIVERTPVAFVRQGNHIGLVDGSGVLLDMPADAKAEAHYSFPVVTGISGEEPLSTRAARMKIYERFTADLDGGGDKISQGLSEVDLSNPEDVKAMIPDHTSEVQVHFGDDQFLDRYRKYEAHLAEWRTQYPKLSSVDMRYERQVVLEMEPGSVGASAAPQAAALTGPVAAGNDVPAADVPAAAPVAKAVTKHAAKASVRHPVAGHHAAARKPVAHSKAAVKRNAAKAKAHAAVKHPPVVVRHTGGAPQYHPAQAVHP